MLRTRDLYLYGVLPAALYVPVMVLMVNLTLFSTLAGPRVLVAEQGLPGVDPSRPGVRLEVHPDPGAAYDAGRGHAVIERWVVNEASQLEVSGRARGGGPDHALRRLANGASYALLDERIRAAGGEPGTVLRFAKVTRPPLATPMVSLGLTNELPLRLVTFLALLFLGIQIPTRVAPDKAQGVIEALAVTPTSPGLLLMVRVMLTVVASLALVALPYGSLALLLGSAALSFVPGPGALAEVVVVVLAAAVALAITSLFAPSLRAALERAPWIWLPAMGFASAPILLPVPSWLPIGGFLEAPGQGLRIALALALVGAGVRILAWQGRGERALPPGKGDE